MRIIIFTILLNFTFTSFVTGQDKKSLSEAKTNFEMAAKNQSKIDTSALNKAKIKIDDAWKNVKNRDREDALMLRAAIYSTLGRFQDYSTSVSIAREAKYSFEKAQKTHKIEFVQWYLEFVRQNLEIIYSKAGSAMIDKNQYLIAFDHFKTEAALDTNEAGPIFNCGVATSQESLEKRYLDTSLVYFQRVLKMKFDNMPNVYRAIASLELRRSDTTACLKILEKGIMKYPASVSLYNFKGELMTQVLNNFNDVPLTAKKADTIVAAKYYQAALEAYQRSLRIDARQFEANSGYGQLLLNKAIRIYNAIYERKRFTQREWELEMVKVDKLVDEAYPFLKRIPEIDPFSESGQYNLTLYYKLKAESSKVHSIGKKLMIQTGNNNGRKEDIEGPAINITAPTDNDMKLMKINAKAITVAGSASDTSGIYMVTINGQEAAFDQLGAFKKNIPLTVGINTITVKALDLKMNSTAKQIKVERIAGNFDPDIPLAIKPADIDPETRYFALIISVEKYNDKSLNNLNYPEANADSLLNLLQANYIFNSSRMIRIKDPNRRQLLRVLDSLSGVIGKDDNLLIFYAGHGEWNEARQQGYWIPSDGQKLDRSNWVSNGDIKESLAAIHSRHTLLISDACFSGSIFKARNVMSSAPASIRERYRFPSRRAITSGSLQTVPDKSIFMKYLLEELQKNHEGYLTALQLFERFSSKVTDESPNHQVALYGEILGTEDQKNGDFIFVRRH